MKVGTGCLISFLNDVWCAPLSLSKLYPDLYALSVAKSVTVEEFLSERVPESLLWPPDIEEGLDHQLTEAFFSNQEVNLCCLSV